MQLTLLTPLSDTLNQSYSFSSMTEDLLANMNISFSGFLELKRDTHPIKTGSLGADGLWSADMLYRHLQFLEGLVPRTVSYNHAYIIAGDRLTTQLSL
jgi:hypothetical protein